MTKRILFLAANPAGTTRPRLDEEARAIQDEIRRASQRDLFEFVARMAARPMDLLRALREVKPAIVHFAGHAGTDGIYLVSDDGRPARVTGDTLIATFRAAGESVQIVVLNGCSTAGLAQALCDLVPVCVGTSAAISDDAARTFSDGFYGALSSGESVMRACLQGTAAMRLTATGDHEPRLYHRPDIDPSQVTFDERGTGAAIAGYRRRKVGSFERWDLRTAGPTPMAGNRPTEITLDDMYIALRFDTTLDPSRLDRGALIPPDALLGPQRSQVIVGGAGSGKTTWMRWTFRRLIQDPRAVPFFLELRKIAATWETPSDVGHSIDSYLADELTECGVPDAAGVVTALLVDSSGPQPVILIDGWDELGSRGERIRERLVEFCGAFPRAVVVVSSRPYGDTRPAGAEAFETLQIQPLSDSDVRLLARNFHRRVHGLDESAEARATDEFMAALTAAPDTRALASTALLLTMILLLNREEPLPDRRHKLYTACLRTMLLHRATQRERDGVVVDLDQWRPDDTEERLRRVAELAYRMQTDGYQKSRRAPVSHAWNAAVELLHAGWTRDQRERFLRWMVASAGVLIDRTDGSVHFAHLSFQEHLAAYYLFITREGDERITMVRAHMGDRSWWETLRLWAALTGDHWPDRLSPVLAMLREDTDGYWLAGMMFADGAGTTSDLDVWAAGLAARLSDPLDAGDDCAEAWGASKQSERRATLTDHLTSVQGGLHWLEATWHADWCHRARIEAGPGPALLDLEAPIDSAGATARSRVLFGSAASWPDGGELAVLRLWPAARGRIGVRLQTALSLGASPSEVIDMLRGLVARDTPRWREHQTSLWDQYFVRYFRRYFGEYFGRDFLPYFTQDLGRDFGRYFVQYFGDFARYFARDFARYFARHLEHGFARGLDQRIGRDSIRSFGSNLARDFGWNFARYFGRYFSRDFARYWDFGYRRWGLTALDPHRRDFVQEFSQEFNRDFVEAFLWDYIRDLCVIEPTAGTPWLLEFAFVELGSGFGRAASRAVLAHGDVSSSVPLLALFGVACRASFAPGDEPLRAATAHACDTFLGDPLWPALARHVARISTSEDRVLLEDLARHPEHRQPPLSWGLQYYVRGDLVSSDDSILTLDELCVRAGLAPLPFLESMPDELEIPLEGASP